MAKFVLDYFEIPAPDAGVSSAFFEQAFGWSVADFGGTYKEMRGAGLLWGINADSADKARQPMGAIRTADLSAAEAAVVAAGGQITKPSYDYPGGRRFMFREPGGVEFAVYKPD